MKNQKGFTLIESIIYIALFAIIIGGGMVGTYHIIQATDASYNHIILQEEANFLFRKIDWALTGATAVTTNSPNTVVIFKPISKVSTQFIFDEIGDSLTMQKNYNTPIILNSGSIAVSKTSFKKTSGLNGKPDKITADFTLTTVQAGRPVSQYFYFTKYLRP